MIDGFQVPTYLKCQGLVVITKKNSFYLWFLVKYVIYLKFTKKTRIIDGLICQDTQDQLVKFKIIVFVRDIIGLCKFLKLFESILHMINECD